MEESKLEAYYYPMLVSAVSGRPNTAEELVARWKFFKSLPQIFRDILMSQEVPLAVKYISEQYTLGEARTTELSRIIRGVFFGELTKEQLSQAVAQRLGIQEQRAAQEIAKLIDTRILSITPKPEEPDLSGLNQLSISEAIRRYKGVGEQLVSANPLKLRIFPSPVKPSIKNWIADYQDNLGVQKHEMMERGNYLFHSENTKRLTAGERQKLGIVLKSLDDNSPVLVNPELQEIVFPRMEGGAQMETPVSQGPAQSQGGVRFSSSQTLPAERGAAPQRPSLGNRPGGGMV
ncbi:hypothetical protein EPO05_01690 [Patescibacteria group bacterium]|nr:MAG: hypothetical protein EPO05_01690 [Patescibacteria group bacterium]